MEETFFFYISLQMIVASEGFTSTSGGDSIKFVWSYSFTFIAKQSKTSPIRNGIKREFSPLEYVRKAEDFSSTPTPPPT
jgi:hypothetical protein